MKTTTNRHKLDNEVIQTLVTRHNIKGSFNNYNLLYEL